FVIYQFPQLLQQLVLGRKVIIFLLFNARKMLASSLFEQAIVCIKLNIQFVRLVGEIRFISSLGNEFLKGFFPLCIPQLIVVRLHFLQYSFYFIDIIFFGKRSQHFYQLFLAIVRIVYLLILIFMIVILFFFSIGLFFCFCFQVLFGL